MFSYPGALAEMDLRSLQRVMGPSKMRSEWWGRRMVGALVRTAREARGLSIGDVADRTKLRASIVESIESDDFGGCGGEVYARGHLKSIAVVLGIDPGELLAAYEVTLR